MPEPVTITDADRALLRQLQRDGRLSNQELADAVASSPSTAWRRVQALEASGVIARYAALLDPARAGLGFSAMVHVSLSRHDAAAVRAFVTAVKDRDEVLQCFATTGDADYILRVVLPDLDAYTSFLNTVLFTLPGIVKLNTNVVLESVKDSPALPV